MTQTQILALLLVNIFSATLYRLFIARGELVRKYLSDYRIGQRNVYLIAGFWNQADRAYQYIDFPEDVNLIALNFSVFGYHPRHAGRRISRSVVLSDDICAISIGAKAVEYSTTFAIARHVALICPCSHPRALKRRYFWTIRLLSPLLEVISALFGWLAFLPIIPIKLGGHASIALVADQLFWMAYGDPENDDYRRVGLVMSHADEFLRNGTLERIYQAAPVQLTVEGLHARTDLPEMAGEYASAIKIIFN